MNEELVYNKNYIPMTRSELIDRLKKALKDKRFQHVLRVEETAIKLAEQYGVD